MLMRRLNFVVLFLLTLACASFLRLPNQLSPVTATPTGAVLTSPTIVPSPPLLPTSQSSDLTQNQPSNLPTPQSPNLPVPQSPSLPTPAIDFADLSPYRRAMLPDFAGDVDAVAATGASLYYLEVNLEPAAGQGLTLTGIETIHYTNTEAVPLPDLYFHLYPNLRGYGGQMQVETVIVNQQPLTPILEADNTALRLPLPTPLPPGAVVDISLSYEALVPAGKQQGYNIFSYSNGAVALAGFFPIMAVYDDHGWDIRVPPPYGDATYLDTALFQVRLTIPSKMVVAASGSLLETVPHNDQTQTLLFASGPMRDFYVVMREDYQRLTEIVDGVVINSYYPPGLEQGGQLALDYATNALRIFKQHFGPYPYAEFDLAATPTTAGGIEYPGIVVVTENVYGQPGGFFEHATVHEVAHQWWYGLVGNDQVEEPWLDESLTNYSTVIYWQEIRGEETAEKIITALFLEPYEQAKEQDRDRAVIGPVSSFTQGEYGAFVYGKGPLFFHALRQEVGDETYFEIMQSYYDQYKYKLATSGDLFQTIEQVSGRNIEPLAETWLQAP